MKIFRKQGVVLVAVVLSLSAASNSYGGFRTEVHKLRAKASAAVAGGRGNLTVGLTRSREKDYQKNLEALDQHRNKLGALKADREVQNNILAKARKAHVQWLAAGNKEEAMLAGQAARVASGKVAALGVEIKSQDKITNRFDTRVGKLAKKLGIERPVSAPTAVSTSASVHSALGSVSGSVVAPHDSVSQVGSAHSSAAAPAPVPPPPAPVVSPSSSSERRRASGAGSNPSSSSATSTSGHAGTLPPSLTSPPSPASGRSAVAATSIPTSAVASGRGSSHSSQRPAGSPRLGSAAAAPVANSGRRSSSRMETSTQTGGRVDASTQTESSVDASTQTDVHSTSATESRAASIAAAAPGEGQRLSSENLAQLARESMSNKERIRDWNVSQRNREDFVEFEWNHQRNKNTRDDKVRRQSLPGTQGDMQGPVPMVGRPPSQSARSSSHASESSSLRDVVTHHHDISLSSDAGSRESSITPPALSLQPGDPVSRSLWETHNLSAFSFPEVTSETGSIVSSANTISRSDRTQSGSASLLAAAAVPLPASETGSIVSSANTISRSDRAQSGSASLLAAAAVPLPASETGSIVSSANTISRSDRTQSGSASVISDSSTTGTQFRPSLSQNSIPPQNGPRLLEKVRDLSPTNESWLNWLRSGVSSAFSYLIPG